MTKFPLHKMKAKDINGNKKDNFRFYMLEDYEKLLLGFDPLTL
jgi:hypothetical protein